MPAMVPTNDILSLARTRQTPARSFYITLHSCAAECQTYHWHVCSPQRFRKRGHLGGDAFDGDSPADRDSHEVSLGTLDSIGAAPHGGTVQ